MTDSQSLVHNNDENLTAYFFDETITSNVNLRNETRTDFSVTRRPTARMSENNIQTDASHMFDDVIHVRTVEHLEYHRSSSATCAEMCADVLRYIRGLDVSDKRTILDVDSGDAITGKVGKIPLGNAHPNTRLKVLLVM